MARKCTTDGEDDMDAPDMHYKKGGMVSDGEPDMAAPGMKKMVKMHGHKEMTGKNHGHNEMADKKKHGHKPMHHVMKKSRGA